MSDEIRHDLTPDAKTSSELVFTDEDLKRLRDDIKPNNAWYSTIAPLLARLAAAEQVCYVLMNTRSISTATTWLKLSGWLRAYGKVAALGDSEKGGKENG